MAQKRQENNGEGLLVTAARKLGKAAGKIAAVSGVKPEPQSPEQTKPHPRRGALAPKNKTRLPRRQKKQAKKQAAKRTRSAGS